jgi:LCP family protein required for cell wall assembly
MEGMGWRKINNVNAYAEAKNPGSGGLAISQALGDVLNIPIDYYVRMDFDGFVNIIDELDGVEVYVDNILDDKKYPILGMEDAEPYEARYETLYLPVGWQKMDGSLALKYVRSRHAYGIEGSDFARSRRQQKVIEAAKEKFLSKSIIFRPTIITNVIDELQEHMSTNLKIWEIIKLWDIAKNISKENITNKVLDNSSSGLLVDARGEDNAYILTPRSGDFSEIQYLVNNIFSDAPIQTKEKVAVEKATLEVRNGTWINGLASVTAMDLEKYGFNISRIGNCSQQNFQKSVIYDLTFGEKMESLSVLKEKTGANASFSMPQWLIDEIREEVADEKNPEQPDFVLVLGQDADKNSSGTANIEE